MTNPLVKPSIAFLTSLPVATHGYCTKHGIWEGTEVEVAVN